MERNVTSKSVNMKLLSNPKTEYLLDASLEYLHNESLEWLNEMDFWRDEMAFFQKLLHKEGLKDAFPSERLAALDKQLIGIITNKLEKIMNEVRDHERSLAALIKTTSFQKEENYRHMHRQLLWDIWDIHTAIRNFKKDVFAFVRRYQPSTCINLYEQNYRF
jgi:hypothetical protein